MTDAELNRQMLKSAARGRLAARFNDFNADRVWRDADTRRNWLKEVQESRVKYDQGVKGIMREHRNNPDKMRLLAALREHNANSPTPGSWFYKVVERQFGLTQDNIARWKSEWIEPVWQNESWFRQSPWIYVHQVHQSEDDPTQIAYNRSIDNIKRDIQTRTKPGRYLAQFFGDVLTEGEIREWAEKQVANASLKADLKYIENDNPDGWVDIYERGPSSCMKGDECVKVYAYPGNGLRLAYLDSAGEIVARAIVRDDGETKGYLRIYPNDNSTQETRWNRHMKAMLEAAGYENQITLQNVKLTRINHNYDNAVMCPYIDMGAGGPQEFDAYDNYLMVRHGGDFEATNTGGWVELEEPGRDCDCCGERTDEDNLTYVEYDDQSVCEHCLNEHYTYAYGRRYPDYYPNDDVIRCESNDEYYLEEYASNHSVYQCRATDEWYHIDDMVCCDAGQYEGDYIHADEAVQESKTEKWMYQGDCTQINGEWVSDEFVGTCHITGDDIDIRNGVTIETHTCRSRWGVPHAQRVHVSPDAWTRELILDNFVKCGDLLLPNTYYGECITTGFEPANVEYGEDFDGEHLEDMFEDELAEAA